MSRELTIPPALLAADTIGVVSLSKRVPEEELRKAVSVFEAAGFKVRLGRSTMLAEGQFAGSPEARARDLEDMFRDQEIRAVFCSRGGYSAVAVSELVDYGVIRANPKIFVGFSDITAMLLAIERKAGLVTFHGPMLQNFIAGPSPISYDNMLYVLSGAAQTINLRRGAADRMRVLRPGRTNGVLRGGNLTLLVDSLGTDTEVDTDGAILFVEETKEPYYKIDRMLVHLRRAGKLKGLAGLIVGEMTGFPEDEIDFGLSLDEIVMHAMDGVDVPIVSGVSCGHGKNILTFPVGLDVGMVLEEGRTELVLETPPVQARAKG